MKVGENLVNALQMTEDSSAVSSSPASLAEAMRDRSEQAAGFLKALAHEGRLLILCHLTHGEKSVTELENLLGQRQAAVSQQLARLRMEGLVRFRRDGKTIYYSIGDERAETMVRTLYDLFCADLEA